MSAPAPTTTTTAPPPRARSGDPAAVIRDVFGSAGDDAVAIARCESGLDPHATNPAGYYGLFQIGSGHASAFEAVTGTDWESGRFDSRANSEYAKHLYDRDGWSHWGCRHEV